MSGSADREPVLTGASLTALAPALPTHAKEELLSWDSTRVPSEQRSFLAAEHVRPMISPYDPFLSQNSQGFCTCEIPVPMSQLSAVSGSQDFYTDTWAMPFLRGQG